MKRTIIALALVPLILLATAFGLNKLARANAQKEHVALMETLLEGGKDFVKIAYDGEDETIRSIHKCSEGYIIETVTQGYADEIVMLVAVSNDGKVMGLVVNEAHETPGIGSRILTDHEFLSQFLSKSGSFTIGSADSSAADSFSSATGNTSSTSGETVYVDGISGATVSSKAVARSVNAAVAYVTGADIDSSATTWGG